MNNEAKHQTLNELSAIYRLQGPAAKGYKIIIKYLGKNDHEELAILLRDHREEGINDDWEINNRDNVDYLMQYYSFLAVGLVANVLPQQLNEEVNHEIRLVLKAKSIKPYYQTYYPLWLPRVLAKKGTRSVGEKTPYKKAYTLYMQVLDLISERVKDDNIATFLWFLDDGYNGDYNISDLLEKLEDPKALKQSLEKKKPNEADKAFRGMINYFSFMDEFYDLLQKLDNYKLFQSAVWHLEGYWFKEIKADLYSILRDTIHIAHNQLNLSAEEQEVRKGKDSIRLFEEKVNKLTSNEYSQPLQDLIKTMK